MKNRNYRQPPIVWLKITDYMHGWLQYELGGEAMVGEQRVVCVQHLEGVRPILRMETTEDMMEKQRVGNALSDTRINCFRAGLDIDAEVMKREYGVTREKLALYVPVECPRMCITANRVLRTWTLDTCLGERQATALQRLLREAFWQALADYNRRYAQEQDGEKYYAVDMIESFCRRTKTPDMYVDAIRREWQRRLKR